MPESRDRKPYVFNVASYYNSLGGVLCVIDGLMIALFASAKTYRDDATTILVRNCVFGAIMAFGILLMLVRKKLEIRADSGAIHESKGIWPFLATSEMTLALVSSLSITTFPQRSGHGYRATLKYSDGRSLRIVQTVVPSELKVAVDLAKALSLSIQVQPHLSSADPFWDAVSIDPPVSDPLP